MNEEQKPNAIWLDLFVGRISNNDGAVEYSPQTQERSVQQHTGKFHVDRKELHRQLDALIDKVKDIDEYLIREQAEKWSERVWKKA